MFRTFVYHIITQNPLIVKDFFPFYPFFHKFTVFFILSYLVFQTIAPKETLYDFRHSCASMLIAHKTGMQQVQMWMGHSSITTTMDTYGHLNDSAKIELGETMTALLARNNNTEEQTNEVGRNHKGAAL